MSPTDQEQVILTYSAVFDYLARHLQDYGAIMERYIEDERLAQSDPYSPIGIISTKDVDRSWGLYSFYPIVLRESLFVASFSQFESTLNSMCEEIRKAGRLSISLADLKDRGVTRARNYLVKVGKIQLDKGSTDKVTFLNQLRNVIVHNDSQISPDNGDHTNLRNKSSSWPSLTIPPAGRIFIKPEFTKDALDVLRTFFDDLRRLNTRYAP